jgi:hypothetical protein
MDDTVNLLMSRGYSRWQAEEIAPLYDEIKARQASEANGRHKAAKPDSAIAHVSQSEIRSWAREQGIEVNPRGTVWQSVQAQYLAWLAGPAEKLASIAP